MDASHYRSSDSETWRFGPGLGAPPIVCGSGAVVEDGALRGRLYTRDEWLAYTVESLRGGYRVAFANAPYDLAVMVAADERLAALVFEAVRAGLVADVLVNEALDAIFHGHLFLERDGGKLLDRHGKEARRYSLDLVTRLNLGREDAKDRDTFRKSYYLLDGVPLERYPEDAATYPVEDAVNTLEVCLHQEVGRPGDHEWGYVPQLDGSGSVSMCLHCGESLTFGAATPACKRAPRVRHENLDNANFQVEAALALHLGDCHGLRTDPERIEALASEVEAKDCAFTERFTKRGWIRGTEAGKRCGTEDQSAVKRAVAAAYGASAPCLRCRGTGLVDKVKEVECRGEKVRNRFQGCGGPSCATCSGTGLVKKVGPGKKACKYAFTDDGLVLEVGCDGTGFDLSQAPPTLRRTDKLGVSTDRDSCMESGDEDVVDYGENEFQKSKSTYLPYLRRGVDKPLTYSCNVLVNTGRVSYEGTPLHQMPRNGKERSCVRARGAWCGYPVEMVLGSTDYAAGELCTFSTLANWVVGFSEMRKAIESYGDPGILHSASAAEVLGVTLDEFLTRLKAKDKTCVDFRAAQKPVSFGVPGLMGIPKLILQSRKKNAGFTACDGPARNKKGEAGYWGIRFCVLTGLAKHCGEEKLFQWGKRKVYNIAPICKACAEAVASVLSPAYHRRFPEVRQYFKWVNREIEAGRPAPTVLWDAEAQLPRVVRYRGGCDGPSFANNGFQSMLADIGKAAVVEIVRECYLGVKPDGSPSPLAGCRLPIFLHDEPLTELILETAHLSGPRVAEIMVETGKRLAPGVWKAETALAFWWDKSMEPVNDNGKLVPWDRDQLRSAA